MCFGSNSYICRMLSKHLLAFISFCVFVRPRSLFVFLFQKKKNKRRWTAHWKTWGGRVSRYGKDEKKKRLIFFVCVLCFMFSKAFYFPHISPYSFFPLFFFFINFRLSYFFINSFCFIFLKNYFLVCWPATRSRLQWILGVHQDF